MIFYLKTLLYCASYSTSGVDVERYERVFFINTYLGFSIVDGLLVTLVLQKEASVLQDPGVM